MYTRGFIALLSVIIISAVLLVVAVSLSLSSFYTRYNILDSEFKKYSLSLAEACADIALLKLQVNAAYAGGETLSVEGSDTCEIGAIGAPVGGLISFKTRSIYKNYHSNVAITLNDSTLAVVSWIETPNW